MGYTVMAPVGDNLTALFVGMKEFPTQKVILIAPMDKLKEAQQLEEQLNTFTVSTQIIEVEGNMMEAMFKTFGQMCAIYQPDELIVNVATGDRMSTCAALSAAYANGLKAFGVVGDKTMLMPIMKLSYYNELSDNKLAILSKLDSEDHMPLKKLAEETGLSISLLSYHVNGNYKYK
ncbi:hypothetical protein CL622_05575, partial [archaeon]|nr:hypothetical protein [archaeon]